MIHRRAWPTKAELRGEVFEYIEVFYNRRRRHTRLGQLSPSEYEGITARTTSTRGNSGMIGPVSSETESST